MILVTGGTGFVGAHLLYQLLLKKYKVRAIYRTKNGLEKVKEVFSYYTSSVDPLFSKIEWVQADITSVPDMIPAVKNVTKIYHCAALISFDPGDYREMRKVNIYGTAILVNIAIAAKVKKICFVSSIAAVGERTNGAEMTEQNEWDKNANNHGYAITKHGAEMEIWRASQEGVDVIVVNPGVIIGPGFWERGTGKMFSQIHKGFRFYTEGITGFIGVNDVAKAMILLMESLVINEQFILVADNRSFKEIFFSIADSLHKKRPTINIKPWQMAIFWRADALRAFLTRKKPLITKHSAVSAHKKTKYSSEKVIKVTGMDFENIETVIKKTSLLFSQANEFDL